MFWWKPKIQRLLAKRQRFIEPEEIFPDTSLQFPANDEAERKLEVPLMPLIFLSFRLLMLGALIFLLGYTIYLSYFRNDYFRSLAKENKEQVFLLPPARGKIYSKGGEILADSVPVFQLEASGPSLPEQEEDLFLLAENIAEDLGFNVDSLADILSKAKAGDQARVIIARNIFPRDLSSLGSLVEDNEGLFLREQKLRRYPRGEALAHVLGYTGRADTESRVGRDGLEKYYDNKLRGEDGFFIRQINAAGQNLGEKIGGMPEAGAPLRTTLDSRLQEASFGALQQAMKDYDLSGGAVVALDPRSGAVRALVSIPSFDPNKFIQGLTDKEREYYFKQANDPFFNRAISGLYPTGSTIKPLIASAALEENIISPQKYIFTKGYIKVPSKFNPDIEYTFLDWKDHGWVDMREAIAVSSNVYFYTIGGGYKEQEGLGIERIVNWLREFGWGSVLGIDLPGEKSGFLPATARYIGDIYNISIGQGDILATPLQVAAATAVFANNGKLMRPHLISDASSAEPLNKDFLASSTLQVVRGGMRQAVESGSSRALASLGIEIAGKTGTAQTAGGENHAWFIGFLPYDNPNLVITVLLEHGGKSTRAVEVAEKILYNYLLYGGKNNKSEG